MAEITIVKPHDEGKSALEVTVNGEKWSITRGETVDVPEYIATEVRRSLAQRDRLSLTDRDEREGEPESGGSGGGGGESSNIETATIEITVTDSTPAITSGEFPDWLTAENVEYIFGKVQAETQVFGINMIVDENETVMIIASGLSTGAKNIAIAKDLSAVVNPNTLAVYEEGIFQITLIYMPEE